jgi:D-alanine-D-alanine ligase
MEKLRMEEKINLTVLEDQEAAESDKPPSCCPRPARSWRVALIANVKGETSLPIDGPADAGAEFDRKETLDAIMQSIVSDGHTTALLPADENLPFALRDFSPDVCFNIAEGLTGDSREAQVPALLEMLRIPYTASRVLANAIGLDKTMTKRLWRQQGLPTADFQEFNTGYEPISRSLAYPMFVKPAREGTGMGMDERAIVSSEVELRRRVAWVIEEYRQPALVEEYLPGREFTVAVMGRQDAAVYSRRPELYRRDGFHRFAVLEVESSTSITPGVYGHAAKSINFGEAGMPGIFCPASIDPGLAEHLNNLAIRGHQAIGAVDISRIDFRLGPDGKPRMLEINTLPGLSPDFSDLCMIANAEGLSYKDLILEILYLGASRFGMVPARTAIPVQRARFSHQVRKNTTAAVRSMV